MTELVRMAQGCYVGVDADLVQRCAALLARSPSESAVVDRAAGTLHELWLPEQATDPEVATYQTARRPSGMNRSHRTRFPSHRRQIAECDLTTVAGLPTTTLARTWWDLASVLSLPDLVAVGDHVLQKGCSLTELSAMIRRQTGRRGNVRAKIALPLLDARSRSRPESHLRVAVREIGLDCFDVNRPIADAYGQWLAEPDLSCRDSRIALEYQGIEHADPKRVRQDITRAADLRRNDWLVIFYGPSEVFGFPWQIGPELRRLHTARVARFSASG